MLKPTHKKILLSIGLAIIILCFTPFLNYEEHNPWKNLSNGSTNNFVQSNKLNLIDIIKQENFLKFGSVSQVGNMNQYKSLDLKILFLVLVISYLMSCFILNKFNSNKETSRNEKIGIFIFLLILLVFCFVPIVKISVGANCGSGWMPNLPHTDCNFYKRVSIKDYFLMKYSVQ